MRTLWQSVLSLILIVFLATKTFGQKQDLINIAVMDLESRGGLSEAETGTLTDRLRSLLVRTNAFNVVDRGLMDEVLKEQGFQMSGCTSTDCAVEAGKILGVEQMVSGNIGRIGRLYTVDIVLIDVETSKIIKSLTRDYSGEIEGLVGLMKSIADELAGASVTPTPPPVKSGFNIKTNPEGVEVFVDNVYLGKTPAVFDNLQPGEHRLKLQKKGYKTIEGKITVQEGKIKPFNTNLKKLYVLNITTTPTEATVYINGKSVGKTPYRAEFPENSRLEITIKKTNYEPFEQTLVMTDDETITARMDFTDAYKQALVRQSKEDKSKPGLKGTEKSSLTWLWIGGGAVAAIIIYYSLQKGEESTQPVTATFPGPPGRP